MAGIRGRRKAIVLFSEGIDYDINDVFDNQDASTVMTRHADAIGAATRSNVSFYAVDPRGLYTMGDETMEMSRSPTITTLGLDARGLQDELQLSQDSLRVLAEQTGGFAVVDTNDFAHRVRSHRQGQQLVLRARLLPAERPARRPLPEARGQGRTRRPEGPRPQRVSRRPKARRRSARRTTRTCPCHCARSPTVRSRRAGCR